MPDRKPLFPPRIPRAAECLDPAWRLLILRDAVAAGMYSVPPELVAEAMLRRLGVQALSSHLSD